MWRATVGSNRCFESAVACVWSQMAWRKFFVVCRLGLRCMVLVRASSKLSTVRTLPLHRRQENSWATSKDPVLLALKGNWNLVATIA